jgi:hypothetical protein
MINPKPKDRLDYAKVFVSENTTTKHIENWDEFRGINKVFNTVVMPRTVTYQYAESKPLGFRPSLLDSVMETSIQKGVGYARPVISHNTLKVFYDGTDAAESFGSLKSLSDLTQLRDSKLFTDVIMTQIVRALMGLIYLCTKYTSKTRHRLHLLLKCRAYLSRGRYAKVYTVLKRHHMIGSVVTKVTRIQSNRAPLLSMRSAAQKAVQTGNPSGNVIGLKAYVLAVKDLVLQRKTTVNKTGISKNNLWVSSN